MAAKRERLQIIYDILSVIQKEKSIRPTKLLRKSNLSPQMFREYTEELINKKFITQSETKSFTLQPKGQEFLNEYKTILTFIDNFGL